MKNKAASKFKNFTARSRYFWIRTKLARAGAALCCACPAKAVCLERSSADAKSSGMGKNFKSRNATSADCDADRNIRLGAGHDINFRPDRAVNFKISNANLKADLARPKAGFR